MTDVKIYWSREMATLLGIGDSTLRKWCLELERANYAFLRDENDKRAFFDHDVLALRDMQHFIKRGMTLEQAAKATQDKISKVPQAAIVRAEEPDNTRSASAFPAAHSTSWEEFVAQQQAWRMDVETRIAERIRKEVQQELEVQFEEKTQRLARLLQDAGERRDALLLETLRAMQEDAMKAYEVTPTRKKKRFGLF
jgi:DNA-binding transcriptional MerR regulator